MITACSFPTGSDSYFKLIFALASCFDGKLYLKKNLISRTTDVAGVREPAFRPKEKNWAATCGRTTLPTAVFGEFSLESETDHQFQRILNIEGVLIYLEFSTLA